MTDRRRINGPPSGTSAPIFASTLEKSNALAQERPTRTRGPDELRQIFLKTSLVPSAAGSAYLEFQNSSPQSPHSYLTRQPSIKLVATVHGPLPLPRNQPFTPHLALTTHVKFAPFATRRRRGYVRDSTERDLGQHLETALRGAIIGERWVKCGFAVTVTVLEGEEDFWFLDDGKGREDGGAGGWGLMGVLAGCITVASAAIVDAGIDCVGLLVGGFAASVPPLASTNTNFETTSEGANEGEVQLILDPSPSEHGSIQAACVVAYLEERDEITEIWMQGSSKAGIQKLVDRAVEAAVVTKKVLVEELTEATISRFPELKGKQGSGDVEMGG